MPGPWPVAGTVAMRTRRLCPGGSIAVGEVPGVLSLQSGGSDRSGWERQAAVARGLSLHPHPQPPAAREATPGLD